MGDDFINSLIQKIEYDFLKKAIVAFLIMLGFDTIFGPVLQKLKTPTKYALFSISVFVIVFFTAAFIQPELRPELKPLDILVYTVDKPLEGQPAASGLVTQTFVVLGITNLGTPSIATNFRLSVKVGGATYESERVAVPDTVKLNVRGREVIYYGSDSLFEKGLAPIPLGGYTAGIMYFVFPTLPPDAVRNQILDYHLSFVDATGHEYSKDIKPSLVSEEVRNFPGVRQQIR